MSLRPASPVPPPSPNQIAISQPASRRAYSVCRSRDGQRGRAGWRESGQLERHRGSDQSRDKSAAELTLTQVFPIVVVSPPVSRGTEYQTGGIAGNGITTVSRNILTRRNRFARQRLVQPTTRRRSALLRQVHRQTAPRLCRRRVPRLQRDLVGSDSHSTLNTPASRAKSVAQ